MSLINFLNEIDTKGFDEEAEEKFFSRKDALSKMGNFGKKMALSALPLGALATFASPKAQAQSTEGFVDVLNYALTLEHLEYRFYETAVNESDVIPAEDITVFEQIRKHEDAHVIFLQTVISDTLGGEPVPEPDFDFTVGGMFDPFNNYAQFMALSQAFEDTGVRAYKGQAGAAAPNDAILTAALQIHSVEARHASQVRRMRGLKGWITQDQRGEGMPEATQAVYDGEDNTIQVVPVGDTTDIDADAITEAWDEPLTMDEVLAIGGLFIVPEDDSNG